MHLVTLAAPQSWHRWVGAIDQRRYNPAPGAPKPAPGRTPAPEAGPPRPPGFSTGRASIPRPGSPTPAPGNTPAPEAGPPTPPAPTPGSRSRPGPAAPNPAPGATPAPEAGPPIPPGFGRARQTPPLARAKTTPETVRKAISWIFRMAKGREMSPPPSRGRRALFRLIEPRICHAGTPRPARLAQRRSLRGGRPAAP
jgi:hypothetical protein